MASTYVSIDAAEPRVARQRSPFDICRSESRSGNWGDVTQFEQALDNGGDVWRRVAIEDEDVIYEQETTNFLGVILSGTQARKRMNR